MARARHEEAELRAAAGGLLMDLGTTPEAVAATFQAEGVRGVPGSVTGCAVARYVNAVLGSDPKIRNVVVSSNTLTLFGPHWWTAATVIPVPEPVRSFIARFDRDEFRNLVAGSPGSDLRRASEAEEPAASESVSLAEVLQRRWPGHR